MKSLFCSFFIFVYFCIFAQNIPGIPNFPNSPNFPTVEKSPSLGNFGQNFNTKSPIDDALYGNNPQLKNIMEDINQQTKQRNQRLIDEAERNQQRQRQILAQVEREYPTKKRPSDSHVNYSLTENKSPNTNFYHKAFKKIIDLNENDFSLKETVFLIENTFHENKKSYELFNQEIKKSAELILFLNRFSVKL